MKTILSLLTNQLYTNIKNNLHVYCEGKESDSVKDHDVSKAFLDSVYLQKKGISCDNKKYFIENRCI